MSTETTETKQKKKFRFESAFDSFLSKSYITCEVQLGEDLHIVLRTLSMRETLNADGAVSPDAFSTLPYDVITRIRTVHTLARATVAINSEPLYLGDEASDNEARAAVIKCYMDLPPEALQVLWEKYTALAKEESEMVGSLVKNLEDF